EPEEPRGFRRGVDVVRDDEYPREVLPEDRREPVPVEAAGREVAPEAGPLDPVEEVPEGGRERTRIIEAVHLPVPRGAGPVGGGPSREGGLPAPGNPQDEGERSGRREPRAQGPEFHLPVHERLHGREVPFGAGSGPGLDDVPAKDELGRLRLPHAAG